MIITALSTDELTQDVYELLDLIESIEYLAELHEESIREGIPFADCLERWVREEFLPISTESYYNKELARLGNEWIDNILAIDVDWDAVADRIVADIEDTYR